LFGSGRYEEQAAINLKHLYLDVYDYSLLSLNVLLFNPQPISILVVGLGGAVIPNKFHMMLPEVHIDILELDPEVVSLSKQYFNFKESDRMKVYIGDAYSTISQVNRKYDIVIVDAFTSKYIPLHLMSNEFFNNVNLVLEDKGVLAINSGNTHPSFYSHLHTVYNVFGDNLYRMDGPNNNLTSMIFATKGYEKSDKLPKLVIDEKVLNSKIFSIKDFSGV